MTLIFMDTSRRRIFLVALVIGCAATIIYTDWRETESLRTSLSTLRTRSVSETPLATTSEPPNSISPTLNEMPDVIHELMALGATNGLTPDQIRFTMIDSENDHRYQISLKVMGTYLVLKQFLLGMLELRPDGRIDALSMTRSSAQDALVEAAISISFGLRNTP